MTHGGNIFAAARELRCDWRSILDFSASINPLGASPKVRPAILAAMERIEHYPDPYAPILRDALAQEWDIEPERILLGNGATELIHFLARTWPVDATLITPVFSEFHRAYPNAQLDVWPDDGLVIVTNPLNPTGGAVDIPNRGGLTLVDESFIEFSDLRTRMHDEHFIVLRSLTKFHALPGLRVGALIGPSDLIDELRPKREPWQVNVLAEAAALAALNDKGHQQRTREYIKAERTRLWNAFAEVPKMRLHPTHANYYLATVEYSAERLCEYFYAHKILLRNCTGMPGVQGAAVRFAIRTREENDQLVARWRAFPCD